VLRGHVLDQIAGDRTLLVQPFLRHRADLFGGHRTDPVRPAADVLDAQAGGERAAIPARQDRLVVLGVDRFRNELGLHAFEILGAWRAGLIAILCVGETQAERQAGNAANIVATQLAGSLPNGATADNLVVAYEPIWAIGTGLTATLEDIATMHATVRGCIPEGARILYGGSVNPQNAAAILGLAEVDGALVGGASLDADSFWTIARSYRG